MDLKILENKFQEVFSVVPTDRFFAPGRINLIGEHIDYNGGLVFPCAITLGTYAVCSKRNDKLFRVYSKNFDDLGIIEFTLDSLEYNKEHHWANYIKGVLKYLIEDGYTINNGLNLLVYGNIPNGSGLSSSASLEILMIKAFSDMFNQDLTPVQAALLGKKVENQYIGVNSGIMDQFAIALGKENHALLLDCSTQEYQHVPFQLEGYSIVIMNTNKRRELTDSKYNERRSECESALEKLKKVCSIETLCDLTPDTFKNVSHVLSDENEYKRARHAITENARVISATEALKNNDLSVFGKLLNASHISLKNDYEVTGIELDTLVSSAWEEEGVLGARMTGAGFGGCSLAIVSHDKVHSFIDNVGLKYFNKIGYKADFYTASIGNGPSKL